jgi:hypothetical protein
MARNENLYIGVIRYDMYLMLLPESLESVIFEVYFNLSIIGSKNLLSCLNLFGLNGRCRRKGVNKRV